MSRRLSEVSEKKYDEWVKAFKDRQNRYSRESYQRRKNKNPQGFLAKRRQYRKISRDRDPHHTEKSTNYQQGWYEKNRTHWNTYQRTRRKKMEALKRFEKSLRESEENIAKMEMVVSGMRKEIDRLHQEFFQMQLQSSRCHQIKT